MNLGISESLTNYRVCCRVCLLCFAWLLICFKLFSLDRLLRRACLPLLYSHPLGVEFKASLGGVKLGDGLWIPMPGSKPFSIHRNSFHLYPEISFLFQFILEPLKTYLELQRRKRPDFLSSAESYSLGKGWAKLQTLSDQGVWGPEPCHRPYQKAWLTSSAAHECELASWPCCQYSGLRFVLPYGTPRPEACMHAVCTRVVSGQSQTPNRYLLGG